MVAAAVQSAERILKKVAATMKRIKPDVQILMFSGVPDVPERVRVHVDAFSAKR
jgi:hypothetical protein